MLQSGFPDRNWECLLLARCNYRHPSSPHFHKTVGLLVQRNFYVPYDRRSVLLRYWHLIEHLLEPPLPSVTTFHVSSDGSVKSNLEINDWQKHLAPAGSLLLRGALEYIMDLSPSDWFSQVTRDCNLAWRQLKRAITFPSSTDVHLLVGTDSRSRDFGTTEEVTVLNRSDGPTRIGGLYHQIRSALWREGAIVNTCGPVAPAILGANELAYSARGLMRVLSNRP
jgi:hypothetical protein